MNDNKKESEDLSLTFNSFIQLFLKTTPQAIITTCPSIQITITLLFVANQYKDTSMLIAIGLGHIYAKITTAVVFTNLSMTLDNLIYQPYSKRNYRSIGIYLDQCRHISICYFIFILIFHNLFAKSILSLLKPDERIITMILQYIRIFVLSQFFGINYQINIRLFNMIGRPMLNLIVAIIGIMIHSLLSELFIIEYGMGLEGAALSFPLTALLNSILTMIIASNIDIPSEILMCFTIEGRSNWINYLKVALPNIGNSLIDLIAFEIQSIISFLISPLTYLIHLIVICLRDICLSFSVPLTKQVIAKLKDNTHTKQVLTSFLSYSIIISLSISLLIICLGKTFYKNITTTDNHLAIECVDINPLLIIYIIGGYSNAVLSSFLKGIKNDQQLQFITILVLYVIQIPFSYLLAYKLQLEVKGIWISLVIGSFCLLVFYLYRLSSFDFDNIPSKNTIENNLYLDTNKPYEIIEVIEMNELSID